LTSDLNLGFSVCRLLTFPQADTNPGSLMFMKIEARVPLANRLLAALPRTEYLAMLPHLESVELAIGDVLAESGAAIKYVYFSQDALVSLLTVVDQTHALEVALVGREGMVGVSLALGAAISPMRATVQRAGSAMRMRAPLFRRELKLGQSLHREVLLYTHYLMAQLARTAACNRFHLIEARLAHRLLLTRDRMGSNHFSLTHEFLGQMLGVRRVGVTTAAQALKTRNLIEYSRGNIAILDGRGLERASCTCYSQGNDVHRKK
jgi:CRP-like cAMP-binding protein